MKQKRIIFTMLVSVLLAGYVNRLYAQEKPFLPDVKVQTMDGKSVSVVKLFTPGKPLVVSFWATWCVPCVKELTAMNELLPDWQDELGVQVLAVSIDDARSSSRVKPFVTSRNWDFKVVLDANCDLKRAMNVVNVPHTFLFDEKGNLIYQHTSYKEGDEEEIYTRLKAKDLRQKK